MVPTTDWVSCPFIMIRTISCLQFSVWRMSFIIRRGCASRDCKVDIPHVLHHEGHDRGVGHLAHGGDCSGGVWLVAMGKGHQYRVRFLQCSLGGAVLKFYQHTWS